MDDVKIKQEIVDKITKSTNILVTVSNSPSVDALSAALGLSLLLDKLNKHATAIFSGTVPPAISFLQPQKTFESTTDSLRDFIIALDKEKADHLKYKLEGEVVKIYITPYKTTITSDDLEFSQGDYNVELVLALGVDNQDHLDGALDAHGKILHDAVIITITAGQQTSQLGSVDWHDDKASSLSEMVTSLAASLKTDKSLLDSQVATALLTGIVAATDRFSNTLTSAKVMTMAAELMAAGADQQLIASQLEQSHVINEPAAAAPAAGSEKADAPAGGLAIDHAAEPQVSPEDAASKPKIETKVETEIKTPDTPVPTASANEPDQALATGDPGIASAYQLEPEEVTATAPSPAADAASATAPHAYLDNAPANASPLNGVVLPGDNKGDILSHTSPGTIEASDLASSLAATAAEQAAPAAALNPAYALDSAPTAPAVTPSASAPPTPVTPAAAGLPMPPPLPDFSTLPPERLGDILAPEPAAAVPTPAPAAAPVVPDPAISPVPDAPVPPTPIETQPTTLAVAADPGQFKIPGQP